MMHEWEKIKRFIIKIWKILWKYETWFLSITNKKKHVNL